MKTKKESSKMVPRIPCGAFFKKGLSPRQSPTINGSPNEVEINVLLLETMEKGVQQAEV